MQSLLATILTFSAWVRRKGHLSDESIINNHLNIWTHAYAIGFDAVRVRKLIQKKVTAS
jgi:hypothetical protein